MIRTSSIPKNKARPQGLQPATETSYRCPGCGEIVDNHDLDAVRFHHQHVLNPWLDSSVMLPIANRQGEMNAARAQESKRS
jgi:hypothetical protein